MVVVSLHREDDRMVDGSRGGEGRTGSVVSDGGLGNSARRIILSSDSHHLSTPDQKDGQRYV